MKPIYVFAFTACLFACKEKTPVQNKTSKYKTLFTKYKDIKADTLKIYSLFNEQGQNVGFKGKLFTKKELSLIPYDLQGDTSFYACYKFKIDSFRTGLITRTPSTYDASSIKLLVHDNRVDSITSYLELAETFGDAGDFADKTSWLIKSKGKFQVFTWYFEGTYNDIENDNDTTLKTWNTYYTFNLYSDKPDTLSKNEKELSAKYSKLLEKEKAWKE